MRFTWGAPWFVTIPFLTPSRSLPANSKSEQPLGTFCSHVCMAAFLNTYAACAQRCVGSTCEETAEIDRTTDNYAWQIQCQKPMKNK
jgi:hypothetical protein